MQSVESAPEPGASNLETRARAPIWAWWVATCLGIGYLRPGPGTWASLATVALWRVLASWSPEPARSLATGFAAALVAIGGVTAATRVARATGRSDPPIVVIDEVAGQLIALIAVPLDWKSIFASFILFRVFDVVKPPPLRRLERLPEGAGIVLDDVGAGLFALLLLQAFLYWRG